MNFHEFIRKHRNCIQFVSLPLASCLGPTQKSGNFPGEQILIEKITILPLVCVMHVKPVKYITNANLILIILTELWNRPGASRASSRYSPEFHSDVWFVQNFVRREPPVAFS